MYLDHTIFPLSYHRQTRPNFVVETLYEQGSGTLNEDVLFTADRIFGVFDGATSLDKQVFADGRTGGRLAADIAASAFRENDDSLVALAQKANGRIRETLTAHGVNMEDRQRLGSTSMAVVRLHADRFEYCQTGDAQILAIKEDGCHHLITPEHEIDGTTLSMWKDIDAPPGTAVHDLLADQIREVRLQMNRTYGVLNGEPEALHFLRHGSIDLEGIHDILLVTDGLFLPREDPFAEHDWPLFVDLYRYGGLSSIHSHIKTLQHSDPDCRRYPRFKHHDDIAAVAIHLQAAAQPIMALP